MSAEDQDKLQRALEELRNQLGLRAKPSTPAAKPSTPQDAPTRYSKGPEAPGEPVDPALARKAEAAMLRLRSLRGAASAPDAPVENPVYGELLEMARRRVAANDMNGAADVLDTLLVMLPPLHPQRGEVVQLLARARGAKPARKGVHSIRVADLERKGFKEVKVIRAGEIGELISKAVESALGKATGDVTEHQRKRIVLEARAELDRRLAAMQETVETGDVEGEPDGERVVDPALSAGYLLMSAQDGELTPEETASLEDRLGAADPVLRVEWAWLERTRAALGRVATFVPADDDAAWDRLRAGVRARLELPATTHSELPRHVQTEARLTEERRQLEQAHLSLEAKLAQVNRQFAAEKQAFLRDKQELLREKEVLRTRGPQVTGGLADAPTDPATPVQLAREAIDRQKELFDIRRVIPSLRDVYALVPQVGARAEAEATPAAREVMSSIDGIRTVSEVVEVARAPELVVLRLLSRMVQAGEAVARTGWDLIALGQELEDRADYARARERYLRAEELGHPDFDLPRRLGQLAEVLSDRPEACRRYLVYAERCVESGFPEVATATLRRLIELDPDHGAARERLAELTRRTTRGPYQTAHVSVVRRGSVEVAGVKVEAEGEPYGDFFDIVEREAGVDVLIGDVSGRGPESVGVALAARVGLRSALDAGAEPRAALAATNRSLSGVIPRASFVCAALVRWDEARGRAVIASAGHDAVIVHRANGQTAERRKGGGIVLGVLADVPPFTFTTWEVELAPGDALVLVSDGVTEAPGPGRELYCDDGGMRLLDVVAARGHLDAAGLASAVRDAVQAWGGEPRAPEDDVVVVALRRTPTSPPETNAGRVARMLFGSP